MVVDPLLVEGSGDEAAHELWGPVRICARCAGLPSRPVLPAGVELFADQRIIADVVPLSMFECIILCRSTDTCQLIDTRLWRSALA
jgi:hypothetical protein